MNEKANPRPLSPHLQIYRWQMTSVMSILHRFCGAALATGTLMVMWGLLAAAAGEGAWQQFTGFSRSCVGTLMIFGWSAALYYHLCNGVRHLIWDTVHLLDIKNAYRAGYVVLASAAILTALTWWRHL